MAGEGSLANDVYELFISGMWPRLLRWFGYAEDGEDATLPALEYGGRNRGPYPGKSLKAGEGARWPGLLVCAARPPGELECMLR
jgi:hypothetical protein